MIIKLNKALRKQSQPNFKVGHETQQSIFDEKVQLTKTYIKVLPSIAIKEIQIKTTLRFHFTPVSIVKTFFFF